MAGKVIVCCKLPNGIILESPDGKKRVEIKGLNASRIIGATYVENSVDADFWEAWKKDCKDFPALKTGALFEAKNSDEVKGKAREFKDEKTGLEPMPQQALGVEKVTED